MIADHMTGIELVRDYCEAALGRFVRGPQETAKPVTGPDDPSNYYRVPRPGILWNGDAGPELPRDGGRKRPHKPGDASAAKPRNAQAGSGGREETAFAAAASPTSE